MKDLRSLVIVCLVLFSAILLGSRSVSPEAIPASAGKYQSSSVIDESGVIYITVIDTETGDIVKTVEAKSKKYDKLK